VQVLCPWNRWIYDNYNTTARINRNAYLKEQYRHKMRNFRKTASPLALAFSCRQPYNELISEWFKCREFHFDNPRTITLYFAMIGESKSNLIRHMSRSGELTMGDDDENTASLYTACVALPNLRHISINYNFNIHTAMIHNEPQRHWEM
jgi:hypothetical protein